jgi:hypothetical protein
MARLGTFVLLAAASALSACAALQGGPTQGSSIVAATTPRVAPAGAAEIESDVLATIQAVKGTGSRRVVGSRSVRLPTREHYEIAVFEYELPASCGGYRFRVYESGDTQILEYAYERDGAERFLVRDYVTGSSPFIRPGLWSSYDHTADSVSHMMTAFVETHNPLMPAAYSRGVVTDLAVMTQQELDLAYREAVKAATRCVAG